MDIHIRAGEPERIWIRSDRFMQVNDKWYFLTREFTQEGPFENKQDAEYGLARYIRYETDHIH